MDAQCNLCGIFEGAVGTPAGNVEACKKCQSMFCRRCMERHGTVCDAPTRVKSSLGMGATVRTRTDTSPNSSLAPLAPDFAVEAHQVVPVPMDPKLGPVFDAPVSTVRYHTVPVTDPPILAVEIPIENAPASESTLAEKIDALLKD